MPRRRAGVLLPLEVRILEAGSALQRAEGTFYGFAVARELAGGDGDALIAQGTLYKVLNRLAAAGLLEAEWEDAAASEGQGRPRRRLYRLTADGARTLAAQANPPVTSAITDRKLGLA
ncbi:helix-turn-helix transcriptional regulator [Agromyces sp. 3263]|uniref:PadR family transcriptional regulator n=1 Tax=Agromyces sp. 3263 TaxID=2817750 RepID=UPI00286D0F9D|nr:helix-turn-helix transcriptional regulator [Agromyces sp. 3263]